MAFIISEFKEACLNLAAEEFLLKNDILEEPILFIWRGQKSFIFGRNQNPFIEIHPRFFNTDIPFLRRISGGGTIYEDEGTLNFSIITKNFEKHINDYLYFLIPVIETLKSYKMDVVFKPKSHLFVNDYKISGNAQAFINNKLMHHGTILIDTEIDIINEALVNYKNQIKGNFILSNKQKVENIKNLADGKIEIDDLINRLISAFEHELKIPRIEYRFSSYQKSKIADIAQNKYKSKEWNFGKTQEFTYKVLLYDKELELNINKGIITRVSDETESKLLGIDFFSKAYFDIINK